MWLVENSMVPHEKQKGWTAENGGGKEYKEECKVLRDSR